MDDEERLDLSARIDGLQIILSSMMTMLPDQKRVADRLAFLEDQTRKQNGHHATIETIRAFRVLWNQ